MPDEAAAAAADVQVEAAAQFGVQAVELDWTCRLATVPGKLLKTWPMKTGCETWYSDRPGSPCRSARSSGRS